MKKRLALGTANLAGSISSRLKSVDSSLIINTANDLGITSFDTVLHGAEALLSHLPKEMVVVTKIPGEVDPIASIDASSQALRREPYGVLFAHSQACTATAVNRIKAAFPRVQVGVVVYFEDLELMHSRLMNCQLDIINCQVNLFDQRLVTDGYINTWRDRGIEVWARSIYMRGMMFQDPNSLAPELHEIKSRLNFFYDNYKGWSLANLAMDYVVNHAPVDVVVVSATSTIELISSIRDFSISVDAYKPFACKSGLDPRRW